MKLKPLAIMVMVTASVLTASAVTACSPVHIGTTRNTFVDNAPIWHYNGVNINPSRIWYEDGCLVTYRNITAEAASVLLYNSRLYGLLFGLLR